MSTVTQEWTAESWLFPPLPLVLYGSSAYDSIIAERAVLEATMERLVPSLIARYGLPNDDLSVLCIKRTLGAEAKNEPGKRHGRVTLTKNRRAFIHELYENQCAVCRRSEPPMTIDHIVPLKLGGCNAICNLQLLCYKCNADKGALGMTEWLDSRAIHIAVAA